MVKIKKEDPGPSVVTLDSDSENEVLSIFKDEKEYDVCLYNNKIKIADLVALFPNFYGLHLKSNRKDRMLSKEKFAKRGYFPPPETGWADYKIMVLVEPAMESLNSTARSTPILNDAVAENVELVRQLDIPTPSPVTPIIVTDVDIFSRFNVANKTELFSLPQFSHESFFDSGPFITYREKFLEVYRAPLMALGPESFNLSFLFQLNRQNVDTSRLIKALEGQKALECEVCKDAFVDPKSAFQHYCSIIHGEKHLAVKNVCAMETVDILKFAKERLMFPPPVQRIPPSPLMSVFVPPPTLIPNVPSVNPRRQSRWDIPPACNQLVRPPASLPRLFMPLNITPVSVERISGSKNLVENHRAAPVLLERENRQINHDSENNNGAAMKTKTTDVPPQSSSTVPRKRKRQERDESESFEEESQSTKKSSSQREPAPRVKKVRQNDALELLHALATESNGKPKKKTQNPPVEVPVTEPEINNDSDESSDFEPIGHVNRPIKGEFGEATINRTPQIPEKELLHHYKVKSLTELAKLRPMRVPHVINDLDGFHKFRAYAFEHLKNVLVKASETGRLMYVLFMASKADILFRELDKTAKKRCSTCKEEFTLKHILSKKHILLYREKYFCDPDEIMVILQQQNQKYYIGDDERPVVLQNFNVHSFDTLKTKPQFYRNRFYKNKNSNFIALKDAFIERLKTINLHIDPRIFSLEKMLYLKYQTVDNEELLPFLKDVFADWQRQCNACDLTVSSRMCYMKHIISKGHIRNELTQAQMNLILDAMRFLKETEYGFEIMPPRQSHDPLHQHFSDSSDGESSDHSLPPDDPVNRKEDAATHLKQLKQKLRTFSKYQKLTNKQLLKKEQINAEIARLE